MLCGFHRYMQSIILSTFQIPRAARGGFERNRTRLEDFIAFPANQSLVGFHPLFILSE